MLVSINQYIKIFSMMNVICKEDKLKKCLTVSTTVEKHMIMKIIAARLGINVSQLIDQALKEYIQKYGLMEDA